MGWRDAPIVSDAQPAWASAPAVEETRSPQDLMREHAQSADYKMAVAKGKPAESFPQYAGRTLKEMALPAAGAMLGTVGGIPGQATGAMLGETLNQSLNIGPSGRSVIPEADKPNLTNVGIAGASQLAVPAIAAAGKAIYSGGKALVEPFYQKGRDAIIGRMLEKASSGSPMVAQNLQQAKELVKGSLPTVGEASGNAGLASLEKTARAITPEVKNAFQTREAAQNAARMTALSDIAGTAADRAFADTARKQSTAPLLAKLSQSTATVHTAPTVALIDGIAAKAPGRSQLQNALAEVKASLLDANGGAITNPLQLYRGARNNITDLLAKRAGDGSKINSAISKQLTTVMKSLDHQIGKAEPAYKQFMGDYAAMSAPINRLDVGSLIQERAVNPLTGTLQPNAFARSLSDKTAQQATGFKRATLEGTMRPDQLDTLNAIKDDIARSVMAQNSAGTRGSDTIQNLAYSNLIDRAGVPTFLREFAPTQIAGNLTARAADSLYSRANRELANELAMTMLDPKKAGALMLRNAPSKTDMLVDALIRRGSPLGGVAIQGAYQQRENP